MGRVVRQQRDVLRRGGTHKGRVPLCRNKRLLQVGYGRNNMWKRCRMHGKMEKQNEESTCFNRQVNGKWCIFPFNTFQATYDIFDVALDNYISLITSESKEKNIRFSNYFLNRKYKFINYSLRWNMLKNVLSNEYLKLFLKLNKIQYTQKIISKNIVIENNNWTHCPINVQKQYSSRPKNKNKPLYISQNISIDLASESKKEVIHSNKKSSNLKTSVMIIGLMMKALMKLQKENNELKNKLLSCKWGSRNLMNFTWTTGINDTYHTNQIKETLGSDVGSNHPLQVCKPRYYHHRSKVRTNSTHVFYHPPRSPLGLKSIFKKQKMQSSGFEWGNSSTQICEVSNEECISQIASSQVSKAPTSFNSKNEQIKNQNDVEYEADRETQEFLDAERKVQEAFLKQSSIIPVTSNLSISQKNLVNCLNNEKINRQMQSITEKKIEDKPQPEIKFPVQQRYALKKKYTMDVHWSNSSQMGTKTPAFPPKEVRFDSKNSLNVPKERQTKDRKVKSSLSKYQKLKIPHRYNINWGQLKTSRTKNLKSFTEVDKHRHLCPTSTGGLHKKSPVSAKKKE